MANISTAYGKMYFEDWDLEKIEFFIEILKTVAPKWTYSTEVIELHLDPNESRGKIVFRGSGRYKYSTNLEHMHTWITTSLPCFSSLKNYNEVLKYMRDNEKTIEIEYVEEEGGLSLLQEVEGHFVVENEELIYNETNNIDYDYTRDNLRKLQIYDEFSVGITDIFKTLKRLGIIPECKKDFVELIEFINKNPHEDLAFFVKKAQELYRKNKKWKQIQLIEEAKENIFVRQAATSLYHVVKQWIESKETISRCGIIDPDWFGDAVPEDNLSAMRYAAEIIERYGEYDEEYNLPLFETSEDLDNNEDIEMIFKWMI